MTSYKSGAAQYWSDVGPTGISSGRWPFRFCDVKKVDSVEEVLGQEKWEQISSHGATRDCIETWNSTQMTQCRKRFQSLGRSFSHSLGRNLLHSLLMKHFDGLLNAYQELPLQPFEIYVAPCKYVKYKPQVDLYLDDPNFETNICLNVIEESSKPDLEDSVYQMMFCTLSGERSTNHGFVIKVANRTTFQVYVGQIEWPVKMHQMMMICGSNVTKELGFNHANHSQPICAKYAHLGDISLTDDDCPVVTLFLNTIDVLSSSNKNHFLPVTDDMKDIVDMRKSTGKHVPLCVFDDVNICNEKFDQS